MSLRGLLPLLAARPEFARLREAIAAGARSPVLTGVGEAARPYIVATLAAELRRPILYVVRESDVVPVIADALAVLLGRDAMVLPYFDGDALPFERLMPSAESVKSRLRGLTALLHPGPVCVVVCSARALTQPVLPPRELREALLELRAGMSLDPRALLERLLAIGYEPVAEVEESGQVSHRGGIVDLFPPALDRPIRVEFWGDEVESLRTFDPTTQRSLNPQELIVVGPAREALALSGPRAAERLTRLDQVGMNADARARWQRDLEALRARQSFEDIAFYLPYLHESSSPLDYLPADGLVVMHDAEALGRIARTLAEEGEEVRDRLVREGEIPLGVLSAFIDGTALDARLERLAQVRFAGLIGDEPAAASYPGSALTPDLTGSMSYGGRLRAFAQDARRMLGERQRVVIASMQARRLCEVFGDEALLGHDNVVLVAPTVDLPEPPDPGTLTILHGHLPEGWHSRSLALTVFTDAEIFGWARRHAALRKAVSTPASFLAELRPGDHVVHQDHGIGRFEGLTRLTSDGVQREYLLVQYAGSGRLYIPTDQLDRVTRYVGMGDAAPALSKLGGAEWARAKQRARESAKEIAADLLRLYSVREVAEGHPFPPDDAQPWLKRWKRRLPTRKHPTRCGPSPRSRRIWSRLSRWTGWFVAMSAMARRRSHCARPSRPSSISARWPCWCRRPYWRCSTSTPSVNVCNHIQCASNCSHVSVLRRSRRKCWPTSPRARWISSSAPIDYCRRTWSSALLDCWSSTKSNVSAWHIKSGSSNCAPRWTCSR